MHPESEPRNNSERNASFEIIHSQEYKKIITSPPEIQKLKEELQNAEANFVLKFNQRAADEAIADYLETKPEQGFNGNLPVEKLLGDELDLILRNGSYRPTKEENEIDQRLDNMAANLRTKTNEEFYEALKAVSIANEEYLSARSTQKVEEVLLEDDQIPTSDQAARNKAIVLREKKHHKTLKLDPYPTLEEKRAWYFAEAKKWGITLENLNDAWGKDLVSPSNSCVPMARIDEFYKSIEDALNNYDDPESFMWPEHYRKDYQGIDSCNTHPEDY